MPSDPIQAMEFAQSKGQAHKEGRTDVTLKDVAGLDSIVGRLQQVVTYLKDPQGTQFRGLARPPKGVLLEGDPGVGKTLIAKAIAGEAGVPFFQVCLLRPHDSHCLDRSSHELVAVQQISAMQHKRCCARIAGRFSSPVTVCPALDNLSWIICRSQS